MLGFISESEAGKVYMKLPYLFSLNKILKL